MKWIKVKRQPLHRSGSSPSTRCAAYFVSHFFKPVLTSAAHIFGDGVAAHLPQSASPFVLALLEVIVLVAVLSIWRAAKKGYAAQQFLKRKEERKK